MEIFFRTLLAIYLAHLLSDFVLQSPRLVEQKRRGKVSGYLLHGATHYFVTLLLVAFLVKASALSARTYLVLLVLVVVHLLLDAAKLRLTASGLVYDGAFAYVSDQIIHFLTIVFAAWLLAPGFAIGQLFALAGLARSIQTKWLAVPVVYVAIVFGGGYLIRDLTRTMAEGLKNQSPHKTSEQLQNAGLYIGWLERFLVITALLLHSPATVGLILTAKSIARYPEFKSERFAEYFLIGTLLSISIAILGGALLSKLLFGSVRFS
ncbi:MAG TPA: DUF3307 domain-containing protein [Candidatus Dormibacteraeota bacterium]|nr:DUF3307 domain-containing protein [Candidatus Dormibacteraeota bacterium]